MHDFVALGAGGEEYAVDADSIGPGQRGRDGIARGRVTDSGTVLLGQLEPPLVDVNGQDLGPTGSQQLDRYQPNEPRAEDGKPLAESRVRKANALQTDRAENGERGRFIADALGNPRAKVLRYTHDLGMGPVRGHPVSDLELRDTGADLDHFAHVAVAKGKRFVKFFENGLERGHQPLGLDLVENLLDLVRLGARLGDQPTLAKLDEHTFRAGGNEGFLGLDQHGTTPDYRAGDVG